MNRKLILILSCLGLFLFVIARVFTFRPRRTDGYIIDADYWGQGQDVERRKQTLCKLNDLAACIRVFHKLTGILPQAGGDLMQSLSKSQVRMPVPHHYPPCYGKDMGDAWGQRIEYSVANSIATLTSSGADNLRGTKDDIELQVRIYDGTNVIWTFSEIQILRQQTEQLRLMGRIGTNGQEAVELVE